MIVPRTSRKEILEKLNKKVQNKQPIFIASAGSGLVAKLLEKAGVDCINTFSGGSPVAFEKNNCKPSRKNVMPNIKRREK